MVRMTAILIDGLTPLMADIRDMSEGIRHVQGSIDLDDLDSLAHVKIIGLFRQIYFDPEMAAQIKYVMSESEEYS